MWSKYLVFVVCIGVFFSSCRAKRVPSVVPSINKEVNTEGYTINNLDFRTFSGRAKAKVEFGNEKQDVTVHLRVDRDRVIWMSITATVINYEVARVLITPDSVKILNKLQSVYTAKPFTYISRYIGEGVDFSVLQDLLMDNVSKKLLRTDRLTIARSADETQLVGVNGLIAFQYSLNNNERPKVFRVQKMGTEDNLEAFYSNFTVISGYSFPQNQSIAMNSNTFSIQAILNYNKIVFNELIEVPFTVPSKYKRVD